MAKAAITKPVRGTPEFITLTLNSMESELVLSILRRVGGPPSGMRGIVDGIMQVMAEVGVEHTQLATDPNTRAANHIYLI